MTGKREAKRRALRESLVDAARVRIGASGLAGLTARDLAADTGCALGSIYTAFRDLDDLVMHVNLQSLEMLGSSLVAARADRTGADALKALARAYARFATGNRHLWDALFDQRLGAAAVPDWIHAANARLLGLIAEALADLLPDASEPDLEARSRTCFAAVHGIVAISLQGRFVGHPQDSLEHEIAEFVDLLARGLAASGAGAAGATSQRC